MPSQNTKSSTTGGNGVKTMDEGHGNVAQTFTNTQYRDRCMACGRPVNPAHGICDCGVQNKNPIGKKGKGSNVLN